MTARLSHMQTGLIVALLCMGAALLLALAAPAPAHAQLGWEHGGIPVLPDPPYPCAQCHVPGGPTDAGCQSCHNGFKDLAGQTCWQCHAPGQDTSAWRLNPTPSASPPNGCSSDCHLYNESNGNYDIPFTHGSAPHDGADYLPCRTCHGVSISVFNPGTSPHHDDVALAPPTCDECHNGIIAVDQTSHDGKVCTDCHTGMNFPPVPATCNACHLPATFGSTLDCASCHASEIHNATPSVGACTSCHSAYTKHAGQVACITCHTNAPKFHHDTAGMIAKTCRNCHAKKHARRAVPLAKCAVCHKGNKPASKPRAQHSSQITKKRTCSTCHSQKVHAKSVRSSMTCRSCHTSKFHGGQYIPTNQFCAKCHSSAPRHADAKSCVLCHRAEIHNTRPDHS